MLKMHTKITASLAILSMCLVSVLKGNPSEMADIKQRLAKGEKALGEVNSFLSAGAGLWNNFGQNLQRLSKTSIESLAKNEDAANEKLVTLADDVQSMARLLNGVRRSLEKTFV